MNKYILALDQGTTSSRAVVFDQSGSIVALSQEEFTQHYPQPGWVEHEANEIWSSQQKVARQVLAEHNISPDQIHAIGITNQRETTIIWDRETGEPIHHAIVWQDRRTAQFCDGLKDRNLTESIQQKTGLVIDAYFSASKIRWLLDHVAGAREKAEAGKLAFGTVDSWLIWKMTKGQQHLTDVTNASRTMLFNIHDRQWDASLLELFQIPESLLPEVRSCSEVYAEAHPDFIGNPVPVAGIAGDQQAALFGQMCIKPGMLKNTYGTGAFVVMNTGEQPIVSQNNLLSTIAWQIGDQVHYALEGSIFVAGAIVQWLRDGLGLIQSAPEIEKLAASVPDNGGVYLVPALTGLGAPHWDQYARGTLMGLTRGATAAHIARAALEGIAYQVSDVSKAMGEDSGIAMKELRVDGGASANNLLMQFQADILALPVVRPKVRETTVLGAAYLAGLATGYWSSVEELAKQWQSEKQFTANISEGDRRQLLKGWEKALSRTKAWACSE